MEEDDGATVAVHSRGSHINKRALRNKALTVSFNEKDLRDYVTGFQKRKKKRRKEAHKLQEEVLRKKRIVERKKRRIEYEDSIYGIRSPSDDNDDAENEKQTSSTLNETAMYDQGDVKVTVITSEIRREDEDVVSEVSKFVASKVSPTPNKKNRMLHVDRKKKFKKSSRNKHKIKSQNRRQRN